MQLGSPHRLKTIYLTNMQSAYMAGRYVEMKAATATHPYWEYVAVNDERTRESHRLMHGRVYDADDPIWDTLYPPLDYRCRCRVRPLSRSRGEGRVLPSPTLETQTVDIGENRYTGEERYAQRTGIRINGKFVAPNAGFNSNRAKACWNDTAQACRGQSPNRPPRDCTGCAGENDGRTTNSADCWTQQHWLG